MSALPTIWTPERHNRLVVLAAAGLTGAEIAAQLGTTRGAVLGHCHRRGICLPKTAEKTARCNTGGRMPERDREICERRIAGQTLEEIGQQFGVTRERIRQIEGRWRAQGLIVPGVRPLSEAAMKLFSPAARRAKRAVDFWRLASEFDSGGKRKRKPYRLSDEERARRAEHMRGVARRRWGTVVGGAPA